MDKKRSPSGEQCLLCTSHAMSSKEKKHTANRIKHQVRTIFVLRKLLEIKSSTCSDLLMNFGNPSEWVFYCVECFETVIKAERVFSKLVKLESKWNNLKQRVEKKIFKYYFQNEDTDTSSTKMTDRNADIVGRIWKEAAERLLPDSKALEGNSLNVENVIKVEIDNSYDSISLPTIDDYISNEESSSDNESDNVNQKMDCNEDVEKEVHAAYETPLGCSKEKSVGKLTRTGRLIKSKDIRSDTDDSDFSTDDLSRNSEIRDDSDYENVNAVKIRKTQSSNLQCPQCNRVFKTKGGLNYHLARCHGSDVEKKYQCSVCGKGMNFLQSLTRHMEKQHTVHDKSEELSGSKPQDHFKCKECQKRFPTFVGLTKHQVCAHVSGKQKPHPCENCTKGFFFYHTLREHKIQKHGEQPAKTVKEKVIRKKFGCSRCELRFTSETGLENHIIQVHDKNFSIQCPECPKLFKNSYVMKHHIRIVHRKEKDFICEVCSKAFTSKKQMKNHQMREHEKSEKLQCKECGRICSEPNNLKKHMMIVHNKDQCPYKCPVCDYKTIYNSALKVHMIAKHTNEKPYSCTVCGKSFGYSKSLVGHMRTHTGEVRPRPHKCQFCQKGFYTKEKRNRHEEDLHSTGKNYQCETCGKRFPSKHYLATHVYETHRKKQKDPVPEKILIDAELLKQVINNNDPKE